jgi:hypothetical protein
MNLIMFLYFLLLLAIKLLENYALTSRDFDNYKLLLGYMLLTVIHSIIISKYFGKFLSCLLIFNLKFLHLRSSFSIRKFIKPSKLSMVFLVQILVRISANIRLVGQYSTEIVLFSRSSLIMLTRFTICLLRLSKINFWTIAIALRLSWRILMRVVVVILSSDRSKDHHLAYEDATSNTTSSDSVEDRVLSLSLYDLVMIGAEPRD